MDKLIRKKEEKKWDLPKSANGVLTGKMDIVKWEREKQIYFHNFN